MTRDVLVIDDSATVRKLVEISLRGRPFRPHFADSGSEGIRQAAGLAPAAILLDFVLPDMTAVDVCRALSANPRTQGIPVLVVTAKDHRARAEFRAFPSVVDFVGKPFAAADLVARIERAITGGAAPEPSRSVARGVSRSVDEARDPVERVARLLFHRLRDGLALLPAQLRTLDPGPIAPQLARRLLTPGVVEAIVSDLRPIYAELLGGPASKLAPDAAADAPLGLEVILDRAAGFSAKLRDAQLSSLDRRILASCDGRTSIGELAGRISAEVRGVASAARSLLDRGLVIEIQAGGRARPVLICEPDVEAFQEPLRAMLQQRATPRELISVSRLDELVGVTRQHQPCLLLVNASARVPEVCAVAHTLRGDDALSEVAMVAMLEARAGPAPELLAAGFDAVLAKPVMVGELERFLIPADLR